METEDAIAVSASGEKSTRDFWGGFLALSLTISEATDGAIFRRAGAETWEILLSGPLPAGLTSFERGALDDLAAAAVRADDAFAAFPDDAQPRGHLLAFCAVRDAVFPVVLLLRTECRTSEAARAVLRRVKTARLMVEALRLREALAQSEQRLANFATVLDLLTLLHGETHFHSAAMLLCNEIAVRLRAERACLGWARSGRIRLRAISHAERFEQKMNVVAALETAMEEALEQDDEIALPADSASTLIRRDHERYARLEDVAHLVSIPLRAQDAAVGVLTIERLTNPFETAELQTLRLFCDHAAPRLDELEVRSRWFGARWLHAGRRAAAGIFGWEHTWMKLAGVAACAALAILIFFTKTYRVEAPFTLRSDAEAQLPAPFDGFLAKVLVRPGDTVAEGAPLVELDTRELRLEEAAALAEQAHHLLGGGLQRESDGKLSEMLIAQGGG